MSGGKELGKLFVVRLESLKGLSINGTPGVPVMAQWLTNPSSIHKDVASVPGLAQ